LILFSRGLSVEVKKMFGIEFDLGIQGCTVSNQCFTKW